MRAAYVSCFRLLAVIGLLFAASTAAASADPVTQTLYAFCPHGLDCPDGSSPQASLVRDAAGNFYGTTQSGGSGAGVGTVFKLDTRGKLTTLHSFCDSPCADGMSPYNPLVLDTAGNLYGVVTQGGVTSWGVVFKLTPKHKKYVFSVLYNFCSKADCADGANPIGGLTYQGAQSGALYDGVSPLFGATAGDGSLTFGSVFQLTPKGKKAQLKALYDFCPEGDACTAGYNPGAGVVLDASGNIYGTTANGGAHGQGGGVFELARKTKGYSAVTLYAFCRLSQCSDGSRPVAPLAIDAAGNLIGTTLWGGPTNTGMIFSVTPNGTNSTETVLHTFCTGSCSEGGLSYGSMAIGADGTLYGATSSGGAGSGGTVFSLKGTTVTVLKAFQNGTSDPASPRAGLILDASGNLYGTSSAGGHGAGTVFEVTP